MEDGEFAEARDYLDVLSEQATDEADGDDDD